MITFWVPGVARTKGSMEAQMHRVGCRCKTCAKGGRGYRLVQSVGGSEVWAALVADAARRALGGFAPLAGAVAVRCSFWIPGDPIVKGSGDGDKLERNVWDALTQAGVWGDDAQVVDWSGAKYAAGQTPPGALIVVMPYPGLPGYAARDLDEQMRTWAMRQQGLIV